jgi:hypothetical protein
MTPIKTVQDLINACKEGEKPILKVTGLVWNEFELDEGSLLRVTGYAGIQYDCHVFTYNFDEFKEYNRKLLKPNWFLKNGGMGTAEEFGAWETQNKVLYFGEEESASLSKHYLEHYTEDVQDVIEAKSTNKTYSPFEDSIEFHESCSG